MIDIKRLRGLCSDLRAWGDERHTIAMSEEGARKAFKIIEDMTDACRIAGSALPAALDEIERLRKVVEAAKRCVADAETEGPDVTINVVFVEEMRAALAALDAP